MGRHYAGGPTSDFSRRIKNGTAGSNQKNRVSRKTVSYGILTNTDVLLGCGPWLEDRNYQHQRNCANRCFLYYQHKLPLNIMALTVRSTTRLSLSAAIEIR